MKSKKEKIVVEDLRHINARDKGCFKVIKAVNTIKFSIGHYLNEKEVEDEIKYNSNMTVDIVPQKK